MRFRVLKDLFDLNMLFCVVDGELLENLHYMISNALFSLIFSMENFKINGFLKALYKVQFGDSPPDFRI